VKAKLQRKTLVAVGVVLAIVIALGLAFVLSSSSSMPTSTNVYIDPVKSNCKNTTAFTCTIVLNAKQGSVSVSDVKSVSINGTSTTPTSTATGNSVTIVTALPTTTTCVFGCPPSAATNSIPHVGTVIVALADGSEATATIGFSGTIA
jgi:hypothetical protein